MSITRISPPKQKERKKKKKSSDQTEEHLEKKKKSKFDDSQIQPNIFDKQIRWSTKNGIVK